ncbi:MAG: NUDIX hydrolase [Parcubacteria group bacterium GW2011_GWA2_43_9b]|nr:MAG: NUDIX hydrolase [Parcubacteria group bacterium GW2011_GWA2_43_9b]
MNFNLSGFQPEFTPQRRGGNDREVCIMPNQELHRIVSTAIIYKKFPEEFLEFPSFSRHGNKFLSGLARKYKKEGGQNRYLITKRSPNKKVFPNKWTVPGGGLETDDYTNTPPSTKDGTWYFALETSLRREIKEEVNLEVDFIKYLLDLAFIRPDGVPVITLSFYAPYKSGEVKLDKDATEFVWATYEECKKYDLIDGILDEIRMVDEILGRKSEEEVKFKN